MIDTHRHYLYMLELYKEKYDETLLSCYDCIWNLHDKDVKESGEDDESHYHVIVHLKDACTISSIAKQFNIRTTLVEPVKHKKRALRYLIHRGWDNKYQYDVKDVQYTSQKLYKDFLDAVNESIPEVERASTLIEFIADCEIPVTLIGFMRFACANDLYDVARRNQTMFIKLIEEHNKFLGKFS